MKLTELLETTAEVGSIKGSITAKVSKRLSQKNGDGSTHQVDDFVPPGAGKKGDNVLQHEGVTFIFTGKTGKNMKTGEQSYEYSDSNDAARVWVTTSGNLAYD